MESLRRLQVQEATVRRPGGQRAIDAARLVPGDVIVLEAGAAVPADARLLAMGGRGSDLAHVRTVAFMTLALTQLIHVVNARSPRAARAQVSGRDAEGSEAAGPSRRRLQR